MNTTYIVGIWTGANADRWQELSRFVCRVGDAGYANACAYAEGFTEGTAHANTWSVYTEQSLARMIGLNNEAIAESKVAR